MWVSHFKYLGIYIPNDSKRYLEDNVYPILQQFLQHCLVWKALPLTPVGRVNLIKMFFLPKFLYVFHDTPVPIPNAFFSKLDQAITSFIWAYRAARNTLQLSRKGHSPCSTLRSIIGQQCCLLCDGGSSGLFLNRRLI